MNFKPAKCPSCGGDLQLPENLDTAKCIYCGTTVIVSEAIRLALPQSRVKEFTETHFQYLTSTETPFKRWLGITLFLLGIVLVFCLAIPIGIVVEVAKKSHTNIVLTIIFSAVIVIIIIWVSVICILKAIRLIKENPTKNIQVQSGFINGECPYCSIENSVFANDVGMNCIACHKRIVIKNNRFYSVDTSVGSVQ